MKKMKIFGLAMVLFVLVACNGEYDNDDNIGERGTLPTEQQRGTPQIIEDIEDIQTEDEIDEYLRIYRDFDRIALRSLLTDEVVTEFTFSLEEDQVVRDVYEFANGYYGALIVGGFDISRNEEGEVIGWSFFGEGDAMFFLFDSELNLVEEYEVTNDDLVSSWSTVVTFENSEILIYYFDKWESGLYVYNLMTHTTTQIQIDLDEDILINQLQHTVVSNQLAFIGSRINDEANLYLGMIDLETNQVQYTRTDFDPNEVIISGNYFLLTEGVPPAFMGGVPEGKAMIINMLTGEEYLLRVDGYESMRGMVAANRYFLTGSHERIRLYDIATNEMVLEREPSVEMLPYVPSSIGPNGEHIEGVIPHIREFIAVRTGLYVVVFDIGDGTTHLEWIVID